MLSTVSTPALAGERRFACDPAYFTPAARALADLAPDQCHWPSGEPGDVDFAFCPEPRILRGRYCAAHARRAHAGHRS